MQHSNTAGCILLKFYIKPQHTANVYNLLYVVSYRNSTSNHNSYVGSAQTNYVVSYRNSTSNHNGRTSSLAASVVVSYRNSTSNHNKLRSLSGGGFVVSYRNSTSNHNRIRLRFSERIVVSYRNSTSNHNKNNGATAIKMLYLIEILHQTTTLISVSSFSTSCILSKFYIKPQLGYHHSQFRSCCILSKFYIKPQPKYTEHWAFHSCILSKFYIKPQQRANVMRNLRVVSYRNSTSNHNSVIINLFSTPVVSYRNSTSNHNNGCVFSCDGLLYLIEILHQTTTVTATAPDVRRCILSKFYIKPQLSRSTL